MKQFRTRIIALILVLSFILPLVPVSMASETGEFLTTEELVEAGFDLEDEVYVIVETKDKAAVERSTTFFRSFQGNAEAAQRNVEKSTASIQKEAERKNVDLETNATFSVLEAGASIKLKVKDVDELQGFSNIESVKAESYIERVPLEEEEKKAQADLNKDAETKMYNSIDQVLAPQAWGLGYKGEGMVVSVIDTGIDPDHVDWSLPVMDQLEAEGKTKYTEKSMNELLHSEALKDSFTNNGTIKGKYFNSKVVYGYNYSDRNMNIVDTFGEQHGQHVGGTIAATGRDGVKDSVRGVAPHSQILAMKTFSNDQLRSVVWEHIWVEAMEDSVLLGADVLNLSLGSFWSHMVSEEDTLTGKALKKAREHGVVTAIVAGNDRNNTWVIITTI